MKHRVAVTVSEPDHPAVTQRKEQVQKFVRVTADSKDDAVEKAKKHYSKSGYKVHGAEYHSEIKEEVELDKGTRFATAMKSTIAAQERGAQDVTEASFTAAASMNAANRKQSGGKTAQPTHGFRVGDQVTTKDGKEGEVSFIDGNTIHVKGINDYYPDAIKHYSAKHLKKGVSEAKKVVEHHSTILEGKMDKDHPIVKEYNTLKKHDIKTLRNLIKQQHRIVDTSGYTSKDHAISAYLRTKHGDKKVDAAFGFNEEVEQMNERESDPIPSVYSQGPHTKGTYHIDYVGKDKNGNVQKKTYKLKANDNHHAQSKAMKIARSEFDHVQSSANTSKFFKEEQLSFSDFIEEQSSCSKTAMIKKAVKKMKEEMNAELEENDQLQEEIEQLEEATIAYHVKKAEEAKGRGDDKKFAYHMENARTARFAMTGKEMMRNRHHLDKYNELRNAK